MDIILISLGIIALGLGIFGCFIPAIPGPPISFIALLLLQFSSFKPFSTFTLIIWGIIVIAVTLADYIVPAWGTKKFGGTRFGSRGSTIGLIVATIILPLLGIVLGPFGLLGIIAGPFLGAYIGEMYAEKNRQKAMKSAVGSFIGFITGTLLKLFTSIIIIIYFFKGWLA